MFIGTDCFCGTKHSCTCRIGLPEVCLCGEKMIVKHENGTRELLLCDLCDNQAVYSTDGYDGNNYRCRDHTIITQKVNARFFPDGSDTITKVYEWTIDLKDMVDATI